MRWEVESCEWSSGVVYWAIAVVVIQSVPEAGCRTASLARSQHHFPPTLVRSPRRLGLLECEQRPLRRLQFQLGRVRRRLGECKDAASCQSCSFYYNSVLRLTSGGSLLPELCVLEVPKLFVVLIESAGAAGRLFSRFEEVGVKGDDGVEAVMNAGGADRRALPVLYCPLG